MGIWSITIAILLVICGILAAGESIVKRRPDAAAIVEKLRPYQGVLGIITCLWGFWSFIWVLVLLRQMSGAGSAWVWWITYLITSITAIALGFMLGFGLFSKKFLDNSEETREKGEILVAKLDAYKIPLGKAGLLLGIWSVIAIIIWVPPSAVFVGVVKSIVLLIVSVLAAAALIAKKQPDAGKALEKLLPYQGIIGTLACLAGILSVIYALRIVGIIGDMADMASKMEKLAKLAQYKFKPEHSSGGLWVWWISFLLVNLYTIVLGFLLGFPLIKKYVLSRGEQPESSEGQIESLVKKLSGLQIKLGVVGIALAAWGFIATIILAPSW